ncbi:aspartyl protease family protein [Sphingomonas sp.]|uniref:aspartyl protease family protein n=1 Tax=Sphingomonas sp. TaxID=28214 RepID=UPI001B0ABF72|nr:aspartyl protease family protein [Sphingomonas sp.]MBO9714214.1 aspartyl protease family protein [Sphingomonas sp.]
MIGVARPLLFLLLPLAAAADAHGLSQDPDGVSQAPSGVEGTTLSLGEVDQRLTVPVAVGGQGPYNFIIDTGAERTVVSRELAGTLQLAPGQPVSMVSMTGTNTVSTVIVPELAITSIGDRHTIVAPALEARNLGASGLLGIDTLSKHMVTIDFETGVMTVRKSERRRPAYSHDPGEIVVTAKSQFGQLIVTDAHYGDTRIQVVLDTGSQITMGNQAFQRRVRSRTAAPKTVELTSVTGARMAADYTLVPDINIGGVKFDWMPVAFAEVAPFRKFGLERKPAIMLGMDALRSFRRVEIDFPNRQVRFLMPRPGYVPRI